MFIVPFSVVEKLVVGRNVQAAAIRLLLSQLLRAGVFDEQAYLANNPDVAASVQRGEWASGHEHFASAGYFEGRWVALCDFSEAWYLRTYPDVRKAVEEQLWESGKQHYYAAGMFEWRSPSPDVSADIALWRSAVAQASAETQTGWVEKNQAVHDGWRKQRALPPDVSAVSLAVGTLSAKGDLMLGRDGFVFLIGGEQSPMPQYGRDAAAVAPTAEQVATLFARRRAALAARGITYLQIVIPEKLSVVPEAFPAEIAVPTTLLASLERAAADTPELRACYLSCYDLFSGDRRYRDIYRRVDTHLSPYGAFILMQAVLGHLGLKTMPQLSFNMPRTTLADVSERFFGALETFDECDTSWATACEKVSESRQTLGHFGKRQSWACPAAANRIKVVAFGNSYLEFAERGQYALSWWLAQLFTEYEFVWSSNLDWKIVDECRPDLVICQTVERFLDRVPEA